MRMIIPYGFSAYKDRATPKPKKTLFIKIPVFIIKSNKYDINSDKFIIGWWKFVILLSFESLYGGVGFRFNYGWQLRK